MHFRTLGSVLLAAHICNTSVHAAEDIIFDEEVRFARESPCARASRIESEVPCFEESSRARDTADLEINTENTTNVEYFSIPTRQCMAVVALDFKQKNTVVSVDGEVTNDTCGASSGSFVVSVINTHDDGEQTRQEYMEEWARDDDRPVSFTAEYPIQEDVVLVVRPQRVRCTCAAGAP